MAFRPPVRPAPPEVQAQADAAHHGAKEHGREDGQRRQAPVQHHDERPCPFCLVSGAAPLPLVPAAPLSPRLPPAALPLPPTHAGLLARAYPGPARCRAPPPEGRA